jgi:hypothetical protein
MYSQAWSVDNVPKRAIITSSIDSDFVAVDQDEFESDTSDGQLLEFVYVADSDVVTITITPDPSSTWHLYAFTNRQVWSYGNEILTSRDVTNFKSTHTSVYDTSASWDAVYNFVNSDSATNNTDYNQTTYVNTSGDTITGALSVTDTLTIDGTTMLSGNMFIDGYSTFNNGITAENNVYIKGDLRVDGNVWLLAGIGDVINVGESASDVVVFQAPVDSDILPFKAGERDLGSNNKSWRNVYTDQLVIEDKTLTSNNIEGINQVVSVTTSASADWNEAYTQAQYLTAETEGLTDRVDALYHYTMNNFDQSTVTFERSLEDYIRDEYVESNVNVGDVVIIAAQNTVYVLTNPDGTDPEHWVEVNSKPNTLFYKTNLIDGAVIDSFNIDRFKSAKYIIEIESWAGELMFTEINMVTNGRTVMLTEFGINHTTATPFVEFDATLNEQTSECELRVHEIYNPETTWSPASLSTQPYTWLDADDSSKVILNTQGVFERWENSGTTDLRMKSYLGTEPEYVTSGHELLNDRNVLKFSQDSDYIVSDYADGSSVGKWNSDPVVWYMVFKPTGINNFHDYLLWFEQDNENDLAIGPGDNDEFFGRVWLKHNEIGNGSYPFTKTFSTSDLVDQWNIFELEMNPVTQQISMYLNGNPIQTNQPMNYTFPSDSSHMFRLHANWLGSSYTDGYFAEFLVLEDYQRIHTEGYLAHKWGLQHKLPDDHTYKQVPPQAVNVIKGNRTNLF